MKTNIKEEWQQELKIMVGKYNTQTDIRIGKDEVLLGIDIKFHRKLEHFISELLTKQKKELIEEIWKQLHKRSKEYYDVDETLECLARITNKLNQK